MSEVLLTKTRGGALQETVKAQLLLDFEANPHFSINDILNLPNREYKSSNNKAVWNRFSYLWNLKTSDPQHYWSLYAKANKAALSGPYRDTVEEESEEIDKEPPSTPTAQSSREQRHQKTTTTNILTPPCSSNLKQKKNMSGSRVKLASLAAPLAFAYNTMFDTLDEAEAAGMFSLIVLLVVCLLFLSF